MSRRALLTATVGGVLVGVGSATCHYRHRLHRARTRLETIERQVIATDFGALEYAERGTGDAVLVSHGIFHGCDGGLLSVRNLVVDRRVIAPSRFGYLGSALPPGASSADQADAFVALLDRLELETVDVIGISAGTGAAAQIALRHRERVDHLVISSGNLPGSGTAKAPPSWAKILYSDPAMWALEAFAKPMLARVMGVPDGFPRDSDQARVVTEMLESIFPVGPRARGAIFDAYVSNPEINTCPIDALQVPTLLIHAEDDPLASYEAAVNASLRIPGAALLNLESGGHLQLGQSDRVRREIAAFFASPAVSDR